MIKKAELDNYCQQIEKILVGNQSDKSKILNTARCDMEEFLTEFPDATVDDLVKRFGTPEDYAREYVSGLDSGELFKKLNIAAFRKKAITIGVVTLVGIVAAAMIWMFCVNKRSADRYYDEGIIDGTISITYEEMP